MSFLKHIAIIPDGNRRWAKKNRLKSFLGHNEGAKTAEKIIKESIVLKIPCFTIWGCSINNIVKRPKIEVSFLFKIFEQQFEKLLKDKDIYKNKVKISVFGKWKELFPGKLTAIIEKAIEKTKNHNNYQLNFMMAYSGMEEMTGAIRKISDLKIKNKDLKIDEKLVKNNLLTKNLPPVDLIIRTGEENNLAHLSDGFMMWDAANAHFYFTEIFWPDFSVEEFKGAVNKFSLAEKRFGK